MFQKMFSQHQLVSAKLRHWTKSLIALGLTTSTLVALTPPRSAIAQLNSYCQITQAEASRKENLRQAAFNGDAQARSQYFTIIQEHSAALQRCRQTTWPQEQAIWVRLYPCDLQPGILEAVMDRILNLGYNQVYVEVFYSGQVLLPSADNPTVWPTVVNSQGYERRDLLAEAISKGQQRGLDVHAWVFTLNFGYTYGQRSDRASNLARNGRGQDTLAFARSGAISNPEEVFIDPYSFQAQQDFQQMLQSIARRQPRSILFDYIRYPRGSGSHSVVSRVEDLWIYGESARQALFQRAMNQKGRELIRRYLSRGYLLDADIDEVNTLFPGEGDVLWQSHIPTPDWQSQPTSIRRPQLQNELWRLSVAHAVQGVVDFLTRMGQVAQQQGIPSGAVFFPSGNRPVGSGGYDSRLQYWDRFPTWMSWHPMAYAVCGNTGCILEEIRQVLATAGPRGTQFVKPVLAGVWGQSVRNRPSLEAQMQAMQRSTPEVNSVSHFAYSWQDPEFDRTRKFCQL
ncbi:family 10 glycosylhydrolase [Leptolyngbya sp. PCC 6406]|uniref:family 10 glycosylhydrolase n=1 Tax=Leptolyngbya sp. PCC 6406 TaxID=1173264 RepID=UPI00192C8519|nr:family 10 glycosylhydrolase [Leptolyngbya sp. PCC 6406]